MSSGPQRLTPTDPSVAPAEIAALLRGLLAEVDAGRLEASERVRARIEGAVVACEVLAGGDVASVVERLLATD